MLVLFGTALLLPRPLIPAGHSAPSSGPARTVRRTELPAGIKLSYEWADAAGRRYAIELPIARSELEVSEQAFGFSLAELRTFLIDAETRIREEEGLSALDIARGVVSRISDPSLCRIDEDPDSAFNIILRTNAAILPGGASEVERVLAAYQRRWDASRKTVCERLKRKLREFAGAHGMEVTPHGIAVDYKRLVKDSSARLKSLAQEFRRTYGASRKDLLTAVHSFVQSIPYEQDPPVENGRYTAGVEVPLKVLYQDHGDCDSKAVLFAALWANISRARIILVQVPGHMLVGIAMPFVQGEGLIVQSIRHLLLEMSCHELTLPGRISRYSADAVSNGDFKYRIVS